MPILFHHQGNLYSLPVDWHEVTTRQYCELDKLQLRTVEAVASYFAGQPLQLDELLAQALAWMQEPVPLDKGIAYPDDLGQESFLQVETIRKLLLEQPLHACFGEIYGTLQGRVSFSADQGFNQARASKRALACLDWPITDTYPAVGHCLAELQRLHAAFAALAEPDESETARRARQAGSDRLAVFGHLNVALAYAHEFGLTLDQAYQTPWQTVMLYLLREKMSNEILENLRTQEQ